MARSRSRSGCRRLPISSYCGGGKRGRSRRGSRSRRRSRGRRRRGRGGRCAKRRSRTSRRSRRRRSRRSRKRCARPGPKTRNPFLNYLRVFRKKHCRWPQYKIAIEGAKCWCRMSNQERQKFYKQACSMQKRKGKGRRRGRSRSRGRGRCGKRKRRRSRRRRSRKRAGGCL